MQEQDRTAVRQDFAGLDLARFVCAFLIVMIHIPPLGSAAEPTVQTLNFALANVLARIAVPFFFICSGFFRYRRTPPDAFRAEPTRRAVVRLGRLYLIWTAIYFPLRLDAMLRDPKGFAHGLFGFARDFVFSGSYLQLWYLPALLFALLLVSFLLARGVPPKRIVLAGFAFFLIGLSAQSWFGLLRPLAGLAPGLWRVLKLAQKLLYSTRDGLFFGFLFVGLGMLFAFYGPPCSRRAAGLGWGASMLGLAAEAFLTERYGLARAHDMYLAQIPAAGFAFAFALQLELPASPVWKRLRTLSALIFYTHELVAVFVDRCLAARWPVVNATPLAFLLTAAGSLLLSEAILRRRALRFLYQ